MATIIVNAAELSGVAGLVLFLRIESTGVLLNAEGDALVESPAGSGRFTADVAEAITTDCYATIRDSDGRARRDGYLPASGSIVQPGYPADGATNSVSVEVLPLNAQVDEPVEETKITVYVGETRTISVGLYDAEMEPVSLLGLSLVFTATDKRKTVVATKSGGDIAISGVDHNTFTLTLPASVSEHVGRELDWALRVSGTKVLKAKGIVEVLWAPGG